MEMTGETKFTPGPWGWRAYAHIDSDLAEIKRLGMEPVRMLTNEGQVALMSYADSDEPKRVALVDCQTSFKRGTGHKTECAERDANVSLLAAAPDLLAAAIRVRARCQSMRLDTDASAALDDLHTAISKATAP